MASSYLPPRSSDAIRATSSGRAVVAALAASLLVAACGGGAGGRDPFGTASAGESRAPSGAASTNVPAGASESAPPGPGGPSPTAATNPGSGGPGASRSDAPASGRFDPAAVTVGLEAVAAIPGAPLAVTGPADGTGRVFVTERGGRVWIVRDGQRSETTFLDIATRIVAGGEQGLLGFAFHPAFPEDPRFFIYYTDKERDQVVVERRVDPADPDRADVDYERELLRMDDFAANHNGGGLVFGPDGYLYIGTGDGGGANDPQGTGQRLDTLLGKLLRIDVDEADGQPYGIPPGNPFVDQEGALPEIWHTGLRNPWRFSFDRENGDLWIGDVGQVGWEEIDVARGGTGGLNFGWSVTEGRHCFRSEDCSADGMTPPVTEYGRDLGCSVTGGVVYRGAEYPALRGAYLFADFCTGNVWAIDAAADQVPEPTVVGETGRSISSFGEGEDGEVYVTDLGGELLRLVATSR